jgi:NAD(P)-dependent dehydrogenase (short-subunit alcohol dehydrogenase family)
MNRLESKVAVITGASSGFGRGIAKAFAAEGARVVVSDIREEPLGGGFEEDADLTTVEAIEKAGGEAIYVGCDVTKQDQVRDLIKAAVDGFGRLDIMFNNAGIYRGGKLLHEFTEEDLDACYNINVKGTFFGTQEAVKQFLEQGDGGNIINLVSTAGLGGHPNQSVYNTSKGAQANLTRCAAIEYGEKGIRVNGICPTYAKTALTRELFDDKDFDTAFAESIPLKRWGEVEDVANLAVFLASDESSYIHGDLVRLDGGETLSRYSV